MDKSSCPVKAIKGKPAAPTASPQYKKIAPIIKETAKEFNLPYHSKSTFIGAVISHAKLLYQLGKGPQMA